MEKIKVKNRLIKKETIDNIMVHIKDYGWENEYGIFRMRGKEYIMLDCNRKYYKFIISYPILNYKGKV